MIKTFPNIKVTLKNGEIALDTSVVGELKIEFIIENLYQETITEYVTINVIDDEAPVIDGVKDVNITSGDKIDNRPTKKPVKYTPPTGEIVNIKCPNCGSNLRVDSPTETIECKYCHSFFALDIRLIGKAKRINEILNQAEKYYKLEDFREAYFEFAKAHDLDKDNKCIEYYMNL